MEHCGIGVGGSGGVRDSTMFVQVINIWNLWNANYFAKICDVRDVTYPGLEAEFAATLVQAQREYESDLGRSLCLRE